MPRSDDDETPADVDAIYRAIFTEHVLDFRAHLRGTDGGDPLLASFFAPHAFWSPAEKDAFFHGLAVHSRLRPDLIAEEVKTKTVADICVYIALLEQGAKEDSKTVHVGEHARLHRKDHPYAVEMSDKWLAFEERMADALMDLQASLDEDAVAKAREEEVHVRKSMVRAPRGGGRTASQERDREGEKARREEFDRWLVQRRKEWEGDDMLLSLDKADLTTLDRMLREDEEGRGMVAEVNAHFSDDEGEHPSETMQVDEMVEQDRSVQPIPEPGEAVIDPVLLALSQADSALYSAQPGGSEASSSPPLASPSFLQDMPPSTLPLPPVADAYQPQTPQLLAAPLPIAEDEALIPIPSSSVAPSVTEDGSTMDAEDVLQMSPASRRRYHKRLYMRRKRALAAGTTAIEIAERLKPGRRPKQSVKAQGSGDASGQTMTPASPAPCEVTPEQDGELESHGAQRHPHPSGATLPYKRQAQLMSKGIDVQRLRKEGLDLFHLQAISKLMGTYNQLHDIPQSIGSAISAETLKLLRALVVRFVSEVMSRAIVSREQERIAKLQTKAWRLRENQVVSSANVKHALALYGADSLDKSAHFKGLLRKLGLDGGEEEAEEEEDPPEEDDALDELEDRPDGTSHDAEESAQVAEDGGATSSPLEPLSLLRTIFPPFMNPPMSGLHVGDALDSLDPSVYMPWPPSSLLSTSEHPADETLLPEEEDETAYTRELEEDKALDRVDVHKEAEVEKSLWARVAGEEPVPPTGAVKPARSQPSRSKERAPRKRKRQSVDADGSRQQGTDGGSASERAVEAGLLGEDTDVVEKVVPRGRPKKKALARAQQGEDAALVELRARRKKKALAKGSMSDKQLLFQAPDPNGRIKSAVYVLDSD
ncbi:hypothetical protein OH76DRAFT_1462287 [Lentinus brumalis]|uniref:Uncharacterized protein n=1 Tax=Lentinus brumalis TaxID=2498619 RepID=A0A371DLK5_9APHY|nr:hypothetical protein OH76DRAFT_1462287 [Polyporus brumalis]